MELNTRRIDTSAARSETLSIINGMRYLKLGVCVKTKCFVELHDIGINYKLLLRLKPRVD